MAECMFTIDADIGLEEWPRFGDGDNDDAFRIVLVVDITGETDDADCDYCINNRKLVSEMNIMIKYGLTN